MKYTKPFFEECREWWWKGWFIKARDNKTYKLNKHHLSDKLKKIYEEEFGEEILTEEKFTEWYINHVKEK